MNLPLRLVFRQSQIQSSSGTFLYQQLSLIAWHLCQPSQLEALNIAYTKSPRPPDIMYGPTADLW